MHSTVVVGALFAVASSLVFAWEGPPKRELPEIFRQKHERVKLPTDDALSVYVGVKGTWRSLSNRNLAPVTGEYAADIASYDLGQTPTDDDFGAHRIFMGPLGKDGDWYAFTSMDDKVDLDFDVADAKGRLDKIVVIALDDGHVRGSLSASAKGSKIKGLLRIGDDRGRCRVNAYDRHNRLLFVVAVEP